MSFYIGRVDTPTDNPIPETTLFRRRYPQRMTASVPTLPATEAAPAFVFGVDPVLVGIIVVLLLIVFAVFLFVRKTLLSFSKGMRDGRRK